MARIPGRRSVCSRCHAQSTLPPHMARWEHRAHYLEPCRAGRCSDTCEVEELKESNGVGDVFVVWSFCLPLRKKDTIGRYIMIYHDTSWYIMIMSMMTQWHYNYNVIIWILWCKIYPFYHDTSSINPICSTALAHPEIARQATWLGSSYQFGTAAPKCPRLKIRSQMLSWLTPQSPLYPTHDRWLYFPWWLSKIPMLPLPLTNACPNSCQIQMMILL